MRKALLLSFLLVTVALPAIAARTSDPRRGFKQAVFWIAIFNCLYVAAIAGFYMRD